MKRLLALLLCFSLLLPALSFGELDEEDVDFSELLEEDVAVDEEGNIIAPDDEGEDFSEESLEDLMDAFTLDESVDPSELELNTNLPDDVINILLLGLDVKGTKDKKLLKDQGQYAKRADVQMILSINTTDGSIKLTSIARNTLVDVPDRVNDTGIANSYGHAIYKNGKYQSWVDTPEMCMRTVNRNFEMNIQHYVAINFYGVVSIIEYLGGVDVELTKQEASAINAYLRQHKRAISASYDEKKGQRDPLEKRDGVQHLDGLQALMYGRLRSIDDDFHRTGRTRKLLSSLLTPTVQKINSGELDLLNVVGESVQYFISDPGLNMESIVRIARAVLKSDAIKHMNLNDSLIGEFRIPMDGTFYYDEDSSGASVNKFKRGQKQANTEALHEFIYGAYYPSN
jgi:LCP family protein required for cell wall assembly